MALSQVKRGSYTADDELLLVEAKLL